MKACNPKLTATANLLWNHLKDGCSDYQLGQDLIAIVLPSGNHIDVSWWPERDPKGCFTVTVFGDDWDDKKHEYETADPHKMVVAVEKLAGIVLPS